MNLKTLTIFIYLVLVLFVLSFTNKKRKYAYRASGYALLGITGLVFLTPYLWTEYDSIVQSLFSIIGSILCFYVSIMVFLDKNDIEMITKMITVTVIIILISYNLNYIKEYLILRTAHDTVYVLDILGYETTVIEKSGSVFINFVNSDILNTEIVMACTGIGTMSIFLGVIATLKDVNISQKIFISICTCSFIYILNIVRNVFIAGIYGGQHLQILPTIVENIFGRGDEWISYYLADKIISQPISAAVIGGIMVVIFSRWRSGILSEMVIIARYIKSDYHDLYSSSKS